jgi:hypothetical protein
MNETLEILVPILALGIFVLFLLLSGPRQREASGTPGAESLDNFRAIHYQHFPLIRQALSAADEAYLRQRVAPDVARRAIRERHAVAIKFLAGLHEDFTKLDRLARMIAALSPALDRGQEAERVKLVLKFQLSYALVWTLLQTGNIPLHQFEHLSGLIGQFADRMEQAMASVNALAGEPLSISPRP